MNRQERRFQASMAAAQRAAMTRQVFQDEDQARRTGRWAAWERVDVGVDQVRAAIGFAPTGWMREVDTVWRNGWCVVMRRPLLLAWGRGEHAIIRTARNAELGWREKQRIKTEIFGADRVAVEVFPAEADVVDDADIYHLWILPPGFDLPFGLHFGRTAS